VTGKRLGFTLLEVILVITILLVIAAISVPAFDSWFESHRLRQGVDMVHTHWVKCRTRAMNEGRPYRFVLLDPNHYRVEPFSFDYVEGQPGYLVEQQLPEGIEFVGWQEVVPGYGEGSFTSPCMGEYILFAPDGTARFVDAYGIEWPITQLHLKDRRNRETCLQLRGLTGVVTVYYVDRE
jgi:prepilin-type N-terminal cleavage/methylation domain-containing protein